MLCFAVAFGSFLQGYGPYPSATKMALPSQHSMPEPYTASVGKAALNTRGGSPIHSSGAFWKLPFLKGVLCEHLILKT